ncbi:hypothetical protein [Chitinophaga sp. S165]|nr:hypothetical protein [Chitinophaga sp. S165]
MNRNSKTAMIGKASLCSRTPQVVIHSSRYPTAYCIEKDQQRKIPTVK